MNEHELCAYLCEQYESTGRCGSWQFHANTRRISLSAGLRKMLGLGAGERIDSLYDFLNFIHPDDMGVFNKLLDTFTEAGHMEREWKLTRADRSTIRVSIRVERKHEEQGDSLIGVVWDLSLPGQLSAQSLAAADKLQLTEEIAAAGTWEYHLEEKKMLVSGNMSRLLPLPAEEAPTPGLYETIAVKEDKPLGAWIAKAIEKGEVPFDKTIRVDAGSGIKTIRVKAIRSVLNPALIMGVDIDLSPIHSVRQDLRSTQKSLRQKDNFIRIASHELKTPISSLHGYVQLLLRMKKPDEDFLQRSLEAVDRQVMNLNKLLDALLDVSDSEKGEITLQYERFNLYDLLEESVSFLQPGIVHPLLIQGESEHWVMADRERINQVILNLIGNATKYSPAGKPVIIHVSGDDKSVTVRVSDEGPGVPDTEKHKIFKRFYRAADPATKKIPGLGIGLYITAEIILQHRGRVWVENNTGAGASFVFSIPKQRWTADPAGSGSLQ